LEIQFGSIMKYLEERASAIQPLDSFQELVKSGKKLRVKLGVDPTAPDVTLGWYAIIRALKKFQEEGHTAVLILGEFTAQVGDPSGKSETRTLLEESDVSENSKGVLPVIKNILHEDNLEIVSNKDWLSKLTTSELVNLASSTTLAQMLERDDFSKRFENNNPISLMEFFYPMFQGYDSVAIKADIEIGGHDQLWNLMLGREIQKFYDLDPQVAMTFPLLIGTDGKKKMSQSLNNYISVSEKPEDIFGKIMSIPDEVMWDYFLMLTDVPLNEIDDMKKNIDSGENPFEYKKQLGQLIVQDIYSKDEASNALEAFQNVTINKNIPEDIPIYDLNITGEVHMPKILTEQGITTSNSEARRLITAGSFKIAGEKYTDLDIDFSKISGETLQLGKRNFFIFN